MVATNLAIAELGRWAVASSEGDSAAAEAHLQQFYHIGSSLLASKEFQSFWRQKESQRLEPEHFELLCKVLTSIADVEAGQVKKYGKATTG
jgi:hypothetical protein